MRLCRAAQTTWKPFVCRAWDPVEFRSIYCQNNHRQCMCHGFVLVEKISKSCRQSYVIWNELVALPLCFSGTQMVKSVYSVILFCWIERYICKYQTFNRKLYFFLFLLYKYRSEAKRKDCDVYLFPQVYTVKN